MLKTVTFNFIENKFSLDIQQMVIWYSKPMLMEPTYTVHNDVAGTVHTYFHFNIVAVRNDKFIRTLTL